MNTAREPLEVKASRMQGMWQGKTILSPTKLIFPDRMSFDGLRVQVVRGRLLGVFKDRQSVGIGEIADAPIREGPFNASLTVVVRGRPNLEVSYLPKLQAKELREAIIASIGGGPEARIMVGPC